MTGVDSGVYVLQVTAPGFPEGYYRDGAPGNFTTTVEEATLVTVDHTFARTKTIPTGNLLLSLLDRFDIHQDSIGDSTGRLENL